MVTAKLKKEQFYLSKFVANSVIKAAETNSTLLAKQAKTNQRENDSGSRTRDKRSSRKYVKQPFNFYLHL